MRYFLQVNIILIFLLLFLNSLEGQDTRFRRYTIDNGLPLNKFEQVFQDSLNYIWFKSSEGVSRFDGVDFKNFNELEISKIHTVDSFDNIFFAQENKMYGVSNGLPYYYQLPCNIHKSQKIIKTLSQIFIHYKNNFNESELLILEKNKCYKNKFNLLNDSIVIQKIKLNEQPILPQKENHLNFSIGNYTSKTILINFSTHGFFQVEFLGNNIQLKKISTHINSENTALHSFSLEEGFWYINQEQLIKSSETFDPLNYTLHPKIPEITRIQSNGYHVFMSDNKNVYSYNLNTNYLSNLNYDLRFNTLVSDMTVDHEGNLWITTQGDGVYCVFHSFYSGLNKSIIGNVPVNCLLNSKSLGFLAGTNEGLFLISKSWGKLPLKKGKQPKVFSIKESKDSILFIATNEGFYSFKKGEIYSCIQNEKSDDSFFLDSLNNISFIRNEYLYQYKKCNTLPNIISFDQFKNKQFIYQTNAKNIILENNDSLWIYKKNSYHLLNKIHKNKLAHPIINDIDEDENYFWIGTDGGISKINKHNFEIKNYTNLPSIKCKKILIDNSLHQLWVASPKGIFLITLDENQTDFEKINIATGEIKSLALSDDKRLWMGTPKGLLSYHTNNDLLKEKEPQLRWQEIKLDGNSIDFNSPIPLNHNSKLEINYSAIIYRDSRLVNYQYRLRNNEPWQNTQNRSLFFSNLQAGEYFLQIRAKKPNSEWSLPLEYYFVVQPPWWFNWKILSAIALGVLFLLGMIIYFFRSREKNKIEINRRFAELELKALQAQMNPHFIFNTLNAVQHFILKHDIEKANASLNSFASLMRLFLEASKSKFVSLEDETRMLYHYCELTRMCYEEKFDFNIKIAPEIDAEDTEIPSMLIQPHVENAIRHGLLPKKDKGLLEIDFIMRKNTLVCMIKDDGVGRKKSKELKEKSNRIHHSIGTTITSERADILSQLYHSNIEIKTFDLKDRKGLPSGTDVHILFDVT